MSPPTPEQSVLVTIQINAATALVRDRARIRPRPGQILAYVYRRQLTARRWIVRSIDADLGEPLCWTLIRVGTTGEQSWHRKTLTTEALDRATVGYWVIVL